MVLARYCTESSKSLRGPVRPRNAPSTQAHGTAQAGMAGLGAQRRQAPGRALGEHPGHLGAGPFPCGPAPEGTGCRAESSRSD